MAARTRRVGVVAGDDHQLQRGERLGIVRGEGGETGGRVVAELAAERAPQRLEQVGSRCAARSASRRVGRRLAAADGMPCAAGIR